MLWLADLAAAALHSGTARNKALLLAQLLRRIDLHEDGVDLTFDRTGLERDAKKWAPVFRKK